MEVRKITIAPDLSGDVVLKLAQDGDDVVLCVVGNSASDNPGGHLDFGEFLTVSPAGGHAEIHTVTCSDSLGIEVADQHAVVTPT